MATLRKLDLKKFKNGKAPGINNRSNYLVKIHNGWFAGHFEKEWYGWNFDSWGASGIQLFENRNYITPQGHECSTVNSSISAIYQIVGR